MHSCLCTYLGFSPSSQYKHSSKHGIEPASRVHLLFIATAWPVWFLQPAIAPLFPLCRLMQGGSRHVRLVAALCCAAHLCFEGVGIGGEGECV